MRLDEFYVTDNNKCLNQPCGDGVVVIAISLFPEVPGSIPDRGKIRRFL